MPLDALLAEAGPRGATHAVAHCTGGYTTNLPLADISGGRAWIAYAYEGEPLSPAHGGPARLLVPHLYFWKSAKWIRGLELLRGRPARLLGGQRLPPARRSVARAALRRRLTEIGRRRPWTAVEVVEVRDETPDIRTLVLDAPGWPGHRAGQSVDVRLTAADGYSTQRPYSLASAPEDPRLELTVQRLDGGRGLALPGGRGAASATASRSAGRAGARSPGTSRTAARCCWSRAAPGSCRCGRCCATGWRSAPTSRRASSSRSASEEELLYRDELAAVGGGGRGRRRDVHRAAGPERRVDARPARRGGPAAGDLSPRVRLRLDGVRRDRRDAARCAPATTTSGCGPSASAGPLELASFRRMTSLEDRDWGARTRAIHAGARPDPTTGARAVPIYQTTSFVFEDVDGRRRPVRAAEVREHLHAPRQPDGRGVRGARREPRGRDRRGRDRQRAGRRDAAVHLAVRAPATTSSSSSALYGGTYTLLDVTLRRLGIETTFVPPDDPAAFAAAVQPGRTKLLYTEIIANPAGTIADLEALGGGRRTPPASRSRRLDARHAATSAARSSTAPTSSCTRRRSSSAATARRSAASSSTPASFPWDNGNFPVMTEPVATYGNLRFWDNFGEYGFCTKLRVEGLRNLGGVLSPFNAFLLLHGMETLPLRMDAHVAQRPGRRRVARGRRARELGALRRSARRPRPRRSPRSYLPKGPGAVFSFGLRGGRAAGEAFIERVELCSHLANVGDTRTLVIHPASTTHRQLSEAALQAAGVAPRARAPQRRHRGPRRHPLRPRPRRSDEPRRGR